MLSSARLHHVLFETMHQGVVYQDREGRIRAANPAAERILGIPRAALVERVAADVLAGSIHEDGSPFSVDEFPAVLALGTRVPVPHVTVGYPTPDGRGLRWLSLCAVPLFDGASERPDAVYTLLEDVTEQREREAQRARESADTARLAAIARAVPGVLLSTTLGPRGPYATFVSAAVEDVFGLPRDAFQESLDAAVSRTDPRDHARLLESIGASSASGGDWHESFRYHHPTKGMRYMEGWMRRLLDSVVPAWAGFVMDVTEREEASAALSEAKAKYQGLFENMDDPIYVAVGKGQLIDANPAACRMHGMTVAEICERGRDGLVVHDALHAQWLLQPDGPQVKKGELTMLRKDGTTFQADVQATPMPTEVGAWTAFVVARDITARRAFEAALVQEKTKYQSLFEAMADAVYLTHTDGTIVDANPAACRMHGMTLEEIRERGRDGLMVRDAVLEGFLVERARTGSAQGEVSLVRKDGTVFPAELQATVLGPMPGGWNGFVLGRDITNRKRAEVERLRADAAELARERVERAANDLREAQRIAGVGSFSMELATGLGSWSEEMFRIMGRDPALGVPNLADSGQFARPEVHERVMAQTYRLLQTGEPLVTEFELALPDGQRRQVVMRMEAARDEHGQIVGARGTYQDVTEQRALEEQLSKSQRLDAVGALAAGVAHDFNNLLGIIVGYAQCAQADLPEDSPVREDLAEVVSAGLRGASLTRRLLTFASRENVQPVVHQPGDVIRDMGKMLGRLIAEDISLSFSVESDAGAVFADPGQVEQILMNLVINARDAMPKGGELSVTVKPTEVGEGRAPTGVVPGPFVEISVTDTGVGMDEPTKAHMFEAFFTTKSAGRGTGLGLSTVQRIVRQCGGFLEVESRPGEGTRVAFLLPRVSDAPAAGDVSRPPAAHSAGRAGTVLLVEDDAALRSFAERSLTRGGYRVLVASGGEEALRLVRDGAKPDVLLTDVVMPGMGGVEVYRAVRDLLGDVPVLFMSGYVGDSQARHEMLADPGHFLAKPFAAEDLLAKISQVLHDADVAGR
jgi:PAS domain S-box-containing protein